MKILITGSDGFVGRYLSQQLKFAGHQVSGIDIQNRLPETLEVDLLDKPLLGRILGKIEPDAVIHLAAISHVVLNNNSEIYNANLGGTLNLLNVCTRLKKIPRLIFISTALVYGAVPAEKQPIDEASPLHPINHYAASKAACEMALRTFSAETGLEYTIVRPFNHTGPGHSEHFVIPKIIQAFKEGRSEISLGNVDVVRDFSDVRDVVRAYLIMVEQFQNGEVFNLASEKGTTIRQVVEMLNKIADRKVKIIQNEEFIRRNEIEMLVGSAEKVNETLGWKPEYRLQDTLEFMLR
ncbi:MAG: GDP-mannose 4,6-dehydratase [Bacteroidales bacterium]|nr:GDP-mannose 4,6-dehydratase [Bacteroidales bacterium]MCF8351694.1 GDP-mannose 4,6-dehydratase [Bacteroidales bacterium]MCF8377780.1 GDP-mannose 4,6-dehydratase [Bacteroidales bacterium]